MEPLKITARLANIIAVYDDFSPSIDSLLEWLLLDDLHLACPNPTLSQIEETRAIVDQAMPLYKAEINKNWYWAVSAPCYQILKEQTIRYRKRWQPGIDSPEPNWGKRKAKWSADQGAEKNYDLPLYLRSMDVIQWYCVGDRVRILSLLEGCSGIGKKRSHGYGQILRWEVVACNQDMHLWGPHNELMRPIPIECIPTDRVVDFAILDWGWRPPAWLPANRIKCAMPIHTVKRLNTGINTMG